MPRLSMIFTTQRIHETAVRSERSNAAAAVQIPARDQAIGLRARIHHSGSPRQV